MYFEGGGTSKSLRREARRAFSRLFEQAGFAGRMPALVACGSRNDTFDAWRASYLDKSEAEQVCLLVDSEDVVADIEQPLRHLRQRETAWDFPSTTSDEHVFLMVTSMETWIMADRTALQDTFGNALQETALYPLHDLERRERKDVLAALEDATRNAKIPYKKGSVAFKIVAKLRPETLDTHLPSFKRMLRILRKTLN